MLAAYAARPFFKSADLSAAARAERFDAFVVDWIVGEARTLELIAELRKLDAACPIVVLTGQVLSGAVDEAEIARAVRDFDLEFSEKPVRTSILSATLTRAFAAR
jgi:DNA-binding NtrC family response regulator